MTDIIDIKPPLALPFDPTFLYWLGGALILALLAVGLFWLWRRRRKKAETAPAPVPPHVWAGAELDALAHEVAALSPREFYFRLSAVFRGYIEGRFQFPALEMTTEELLPRLEKLSLPPDLLTDLKAQSRRADPVKFAGFSAEADAMSGDLLLIRAFVSETEPREEDV